MFVRVQVCSPNRSPNQFAVKMILLDLARCLRLQVFWDKHMKQSIYFLEMCSTSVHQYVSKWFARVQVVFKAPQNACGVMVCESTLFEQYHGICLNRFPIQVDVMHLLRLSAAVKVGGRKANNL